MPIKFLRRDAKRFSKFGNGKGKKAGWKKPTGRDNKMREKRKGYGPVVSIGYRSDKDTRGTLNEKNPILVMNVKDLDKITKADIGVLGKVGNKKKIEIAKKVKEMKIEFQNLNATSFLKKLEKKNKENKNELKK